MDAQPQKEINPADLLTPNELALKLKVKPCYIFNKLRPEASNPIPAIKMGRYWRFYWPDVSAWLLAQSTAPAPKAGRRT